MCSCDYTLRAPSTLGPASLFFDYKKHAPAFDPRQKPGIASRSGELETYVLVPRTEFANSSSGTAARGSIPGTRTIRYFFGNITRAPARAGNFRRSSELCCIAMLCANLF